MVVSRDAAAEAAAPAAASVSISFSFFISHFSFSFFILILIFSFIFATDGSTTWVYCQEANGWLFDVSPNKNQDGKVRMVEVARMTGNWTYKVISDFALVHREQRS